MTIYKSILGKQLENNRISLKSQRQTWNLLRDQGFLLMQSLVQDQLEALVENHLRVPGTLLNDRDIGKDSSTIDALNKVVAKMKILIQKMQKNFLNLLDIKQEAIGRLGTDLNSFYYNDSTLDDWSKFYL